MYVLIRLFWVVATAALRKKNESFLDPVTTTLRVWPNDLDLYFHVNNGRYLTLMDIGRFDYTVRSPLLKIMLAEKLTPVLGAAHIKYKASLKLFQKFQLVTQIAGWDEKWFYFRQTFKVGKKEYASAIVKGVMLRHGKVVPTRQCVELFGVDRLIWLPDEIKAAQELDTLL